VGPPVQAQVYRWVEAEGTIHYSTGLESVPEAYRDGARLLSGAPRPVDPTRIAFTPGTPIRVLERLGIATPGLARTRLRGVTGESAAAVVQVTSVVVGEAVVGPLSVIAHDAGLPGADGLLGRDFLGLFTVTIDTRAGFVTLAPE